MSNTKFGAIRDAKNSVKKPENDKTVPFDLFNSEIEVTSLISDYLKKKNMTSTAEIFEKELIGAKKKDINSTKILNLFDFGKAREFFHSFAEFQKNVSSKTPIQEMDKSEFFYRIYFAISDIHPFLKNQKEASKENTDQLKIYLEERGSELSKFPDLIPYFAMPYVKNLKEHSSFKHLFSQSWIGKVRESLVTFLKAQSNPNTELEIALISSKEKSSKGLHENEEVQRLTREYRKQTEELDELKRSHQQLNNESKETIRETHLKWGSFVKLFKKRNFTNF